MVDLTRALAGPFATMLLADLGADVIKVESPEGDITRAQGPFLPEDDLRDFGGYFQSINRNKRSVVVDLGTDDGTEAVRRLTGKADILVENFRAGVMEALGLGYEALAADNPVLTYAAVRGFGDPRTGDSPYRDWPAYDVVAQAMGGVMGITGATDGPPTKVGPGIGDILPASLAAVGILAALHEARSTGRGRFVDVAMYDAVLALCERMAYQYSYQGKVAGREGNEHPLLCPFGLYRAADGWVAIAAPGDNHWRRLCDIAGRPDVALDPSLATNADRVARREEIRDLVENWTRPRTRAQITAELGGRVPVGPVNAADTIFADPHVRARNMLVDLDQPGANRTAAVAGRPIKFAGSPEPAMRRAPLLGEHTAEVLAAIGVAVPGAQADRGSEERIGHATASE